MGRDQLHPFQWQVGPQGSNETRLLERRLRFAFWLVGILLATMQAWAYRHYISADGISYLDLSDAVLPGTDWRRIITGTWSPLYPLLLGLCRLLSPDPYREVIVGHFFNILIFLFAFAAFEYFFRSLMPEQPDSPGEDVVLPRWMYLTVAYTLFLWAAIGQITLRSLRADMLMAAFLLLAMGILCRIRGRPGTWATFFALGIALGLGYLTKTPMLLIGSLMIGSTLFLSQEWVRTLPKAALAASLLLAIGSLYFIPLSQMRGHLTFGDSGKLNYLLYIDGAEPQWYLQRMGQGSGEPLHMATRLFEQPPVYKFSIDKPVSHPMRYDPAYWVEGVNPRFSFSGQIHILVVNLKHYLGISRSAWAVIAAVLLLWFLSGSARRVMSGLMGQWPEWFIGISGLAMYVLVHVEPRYVGVFFLLVWIGLLIRSKIPRGKLNFVAPAVAIVVAASVLVPLAWSAALDLWRTRHESDVGANVAKELAALGVHPRDKIARISPMVNDYVWVHMLRATIVTEVDMQHTQEFWSASPDQQDKILRTMADTGARIVVAHIATRPMPPDWQRLGTTPFCIRWLNRA